MLQMSRTRLGAAVDGLLQGARSRLLDRVASIECHPVVLPLSAPLSMSTYSIERAESLFVCARTDDGAEGWGESAPNQVMTGETLKGLVAAFEAWVRPFVLGRTLLGCRHAVREALSLTYGNGSLKSAVDMALLDLEGRVLGVPAVELLGGSRRDSIRVVRLLDGVKPGTADSRPVIDAALRMRAGGCTALKLKVGLTSDARVEAETVNSLRTELGEDVLIGADANMGWDYGAADRFLSRVASARLAFLEQPLRPDQLRPLIRLQHATAVPISADEGMHTLGDALHLHEAGAISGVSLKANKLGGPSALVDASNVCSAVGLQVNFAMLLESSLSCAAMVHAACAATRVDWGLVLGNVYLEVDPVCQPLKTDRGHVALTAGHGLGVEVDVNVLRRYAA